jgi:hypothetical protein
LACLPAAVSLLLLVAFLCRSLGELSTHLALQALFVQSSPVREPLLQAFPFPSTLREVTLHLLSLTCMFIYSSCGKWVFPSSLVKFSSLCHSYKLSCSWLLGTSTLSGQVQLVYLQFWEGFLSPTLWHSVHPTLFATCLYCSFFLLLSFSFFPRWESVCPGGYAVLAQDCLCKYHVPLSSPSSCLLKPSGHGCLVARVPSWFLCLT